MSSITYIILRRLRSPLIVLIAVYALSVLGFVLIPGIDHLGRPYRMDFFHAFYFVSFMGSTIGFGEIPYEFTGAQRIWTLVSIYTSVVAWLYAIGTMLSLIQDPAFRQQASHRQFERRVQRMPEPFNIVCGYGDTGQIVVDALHQRGDRCVALDNDINRINLLTLEEHAGVVPVLCADASDVATLRSAGIRSSLCKSVLALTRDDDTNLKIAVTAKLLNPKLPVIALSSTEDTGANMASFGTDHIINPFRSFAEQLAMALRCPELVALHEILTRPDTASAIDSSPLPRGFWVVCGHGRWGREVRRVLDQFGVKNRIIELDPASGNLPRDAIIGRGTEAVTLRDAGIEQADAVVAGADDDTNNLSIVITAREINPDLYVLARQNHAGNSALFDAAEIDWISQHSRTVSRRVLALLTTPLTAEFLEIARGQTSRWIGDVHDRILKVCGEEHPHTWVMDISPEGYPAPPGNSYDLGDLMRDPSNRKNPASCIALLLSRQGENRLLPDPETDLRLGDRFLFVGTARAEYHMRRLIASDDNLHYAATGNRRPSSWLFRTITRSRDEDPAPR